MDVLQHFRLVIATEHTVAPFSLNGLEVIAKVVKVIDGDTLDLVFFYKEEMVRFRCRLDGVDATELDEEDEFGRDGEIARDFLAWLVMGYEADEFPDQDYAWTQDELQGELNNSIKLVFATLGEFDDFGRVLVTIQDSKYALRTFNDLLVDYGYATPY